MGDDLAQACPIASGLTALPVGQTSTGRPAAAWALAPQKESARSRLRMLPSACRAILRPRCPRSSALGATQATRRGWTARFAASAPRCARARSLVPGPAAKDRGLPARVLSAVRSRALVAGRDRAARGPRPFRPWSPGAFRPSSLLARPSLEVWSALGPSLSLPQREAAQLAALLGRAAAARRPASPHD